MAKAPPQGQQVVAAKRSPLDYPPEGWPGQAIGVGGAVTMGNVSLSNTAQANYMNAATVTA